VLNGIIVLLAGGSTTGSQPLMPAEVPVRRLSGESPELHGAYLSGSADHGAGTRIVD